MDPRLSRAHGALAGLALGDALGMPTQAMSPEQIRAVYGRITGLVDADASQPYARERRGSMLHLQRGRAPADSVNAPENSEATSRPRGTRTPNLRIKSPLLYH